MAIQQHRHVAEPIADQRRDPAAAPPPAAASTLGRMLYELTEARTLSPDQATQLWQAAQTDAWRAAAGRDRTGREEPAATASSATAPSRSTGLIDVLGYVGGALMLGALVFLGFTLWGDLTRLGRGAVAVAAFLVPAVGGLLLWRGGNRTGAARILLALACLGAGFAAFTVLDDRNLIISSGVVAAAAVTGLVSVRSAIFYLPAWVAAMGMVLAVILNGLRLPEGDALGFGLAGGFLTVAVLFALAGLRLGPHPAWTLAGLAGWAATVPLISFQHAYLVLAVTTVTAAALFLAVIRRQIYGPAVVGCLVLLSMWPAALFQILDTALGVALGLVVAGSLLIIAAVVLTSRHPHGTGPTGPQPAR